MSQMVIQVNKEGGDAIVVLVDIARKAVNLQDVPKVMQILSCVKLIEEAPAEGPKIVKLPGRRPDLEVEPLRGNETIREEDKPAEDQQ